MTVSGWKSVQARTAAFGGLTTKVKALSPRERSRAAFVVAAAGVCLLGQAGVAQRPNVVISQTTQLAAYPGGAPGGSVAVNSLGNMLSSTTYGGQVVQFNGTTGALTVLGTYSGPGPVAVDAANNLYIGDQYDNFITKVPFVNGNYVAVTPISGTTPACTGSDTAECVLPSLTSAGVSSYVALAFDPSGNFYFATSNAGAAANAIFECTAACLASSTPAAVMVYQEPAQTGTPLILNAISTDTLGDLFFADAIYNASSFTSYSSNVKELAALTSSATFHAATPQTLYAYTDATPSGFDDQITAVTVGAANTVYFSLAYDGTFALVNNAGTVDTTSLYSVSAQKPAVMTTDRNGTFYESQYSSTTNGNVAYTFTDSKVVLPTTAVGATGTAANVTAFVMDSSYCTSGATTTFASSSAEFAATVGACAANYVTGASGYAATVTFTPTAAGVRSATLTATSGALTGTALVTGIATGGTVPTPTFSPAGGTFTAAQNVSILDSSAGVTIYYTLDGSTPTTASAVYSAPLAIATSTTLKAIAVYAGSTTSAVATATYTIAAATVPTPVFSPAGGSYTTAQTVTITDTLAGSSIYYTLDGSTPTTASLLYTGAITVSASETINAFATATGYTSSAVATATYTLNVASTWVVNRDGSVSRLNSAGTVLATATSTAPSASTAGGVAIDASGNAWAVANQSNSLVEVSPAGAFTAAYTGAGVSNPTAVAIDGLSRVWVANTNNSVSVFSNAGAAVSPSTGYTAGGLASPSSIAIDQTGSVWITNATTSTVTRILGAAAPASAPVSSGIAAGTTGARP